MESVDRLLAELKAQHEREPRAADKEETIASEESSFTEIASAASSLPAPRSLDELLSQLGDEKRRSVRQRLSQQSPKTTAKKLQSQPKTRKSSVPAQNVSTASAASRASKLLAELKAQYQERDEAIARQRQVEEAKSLRQAETQRAEQQRAIARQAEAWLKQISVDSEEGLWFEEFAYHYDSRLEAAIDYLASLEQSL